MSQRCMCLSQEVWSQLEGPLPYSDLWIQAVTSYGFAPHVLPNIAETGEGELGEERVFSPASAPKSLPPAPISQNCHKAST